MTAPMTLLEAVEEARRRGLRWVAQDGADCLHTWEWWGYSKKARKPMDEHWRGSLTMRAERLGTGAPNPDGWRETLTEVK